MHVTHAQKFLATACCLALISVVRADESKDESVEAVAEVSFRKEIEPIFSQHCFGCHQGAKQLGSYLMTDFTAMLGGGESDRAAIVPGKPDESYLVEQITPVDGHAEMPDEPFTALSETEIQLVRDWISQGAKNDAIVDSGPKYTAENPPTYVGASPLPSVDVSPDGSKIAVAGFYEVIVLDTQSGERTARLVGLSPRLNSVRFSPDGKFLAAVGGTPAVRGELQIWDWEANELTLSRSFTYDTLCGASWSPDGTKLAFGATDNVVRAIDTQSGEQILYQGAHDDWVRDTAFTPDSKHVISVARDMSCKLTEVETERFIDNITSITPGALSGGLSSVQAHPTRNEILVGGADGVAKVYRVFRKTARKIGDDANLVRNLPKMPGRIFSVAISSDAERLAAASTLDGKSEVRIWKYDFSSEPTPEIEKIMAKPDAKRSAEEKKQINAFQNSEIQELGKFSLEEAAIFSISFAADHSLVIAASDGKIRRLSPEGELIATLDAIDVSTETELADSQFDAKTWNELVTQREGTVNEQAPPVEQVTTLLVEPKQIDMTSPYDYTQLIVTAVLKDESTVDITRLCDIAAPNWITITPSGLIRPTADGEGTIEIRFGNQQSSIAITASDIDANGELSEKHAAVDYIKDVGPILSRLGCNQGTCHGAQKGKNGFKLSLRGYDPTYDLRALTDDLAARRINPASPDDSLMLRKPLGRSPHQGGVLMSVNDPNYTILRRWIADGSNVDFDSPRVSKIVVSPINPIVESTHAHQQVRVVAHYDDGSQRDVTREAFIESGNTEVATANRSGLLSAVRRGEAPILARYEGAYAATTLTVMGDRNAYRTTDTETWSRIDELVAEKWKRVKVTPSELCDDATFLRRVHLDLVGLPPTSDQVRAFLDDDSPTRIKRTRIVDELIGSEAYIDFWTNKWADLLQVNRKFLGVEGSTKFRDWIRKALAENRPYDDFARQILTASGSNNENPPASYYKVLRTPEDTMENTTHLFLGIRFNCNKCHDHPFERWTQDQYYQMSAFFAQVGLENDPASGNRKVAGTAVEGAKPLFEKVVDKTSGDINHPRTNQVVPPEFPFEVPHESEEGSSRREQLAAWITDPDNPYFARSYVNRLWGYLFGTGLIEPIDDIRAGNPATNPELLDHLAQSFVDSGFDIAQMHRAICNSRTYQLSVKTNPLNADDKLNYSHALPRRLPAEVIYDAVHSLTGAVSSIPGMPAGTRAAALTDSGVKLADGFLQNLGRPARESACECERSSELQLGPVMALISGPTIGTAISDPKNALERIVAEHTDDRSLAEEIFLRAVARRPTESEFEAFSQMKEIIQESHEDLIAQLKSSELAWKDRRVELEAQREQRLAEIVQKIEARTQEIKPERERLAKEREERIKAAAADVTTAKAKVGAKIDQWSADQQNAVDWFPLAASSASSTNKAVLTPQPDRSIVASGNKAKTVYTITFKTSLNNITGLRLEALSDPDLPSKGPGLAPNGNFVLTELEVMSASAKTPKESAKAKISSGVADFLQSGFDIKQTFDDRNQDQKGWAVSPATGIEHWATYKFAKPISHEGGIVLTIKMHQFHNAAEHTLGRFRFSATTDQGEIPLGASETIAAALRTPKASRSEATNQVLVEHISATDSEIRDANAALAASKAAVPPDAILVTLEQRKTALSKPTPDDPALVQLRDDAKQSADQLQRIRLTAAEDLTWALINSPAFLFNH